MSSVKKGKEKKAFYDLFSRWGKMWKKRKKAWKEETKSAFAMIVRNVNFLDENNTRK